MVQTNDGDPMHESDSNSTC